MEDKYNITNPPLFSSGHYYSKKYFSSPITTTKQTFTMETALKNNNGITLLYFQSNSGKIIINSKSYKTRKNMLMCLGSYHYFKFIPTNEPMQLIQCQLSYDTFIYMAANPYYKFSKITLNGHPLTSLLNDNNSKQVEILLEEMIEITNKKARKETENSEKITDKSTTQTYNKLPHKMGIDEFLLCMKLIGILHKTYQSNFWNELK